MYSDFYNKLVALSDEEYRDFSMRSIPCKRPFLGVRIPEIRRLVRAIPQEDFDEFLSKHPVAVEEVIARGFLIARLPYNEMIKQFDSQVKLLDNWCTVDTFCAALRKTIKRHESDFLDCKIEKLLKSKNEFAVRTGIVCLLDFYVTSDYLHVIFDHIESLDGRNKYYVKMALAWLIAECYIKFPDETYSFIEKSSLDRWTINKAISKICDSYRVDAENKATIKRLGRGGSVSGNALLR